MPAATETSSLGGLAPSSRASTAGTSAGIERLAGTGAGAGGWGRPGSLPEIHL